jgi:homoaconitase/3-isopropylmalate dehydratase large subunit
VGAFHEYEGILHSLVLERWLARPGMLLVGADSHTVSAGAAAAVAIAVGSTELATVLATGQVWLRVPESIRVELTGALGERVELRDLTMALLSAHGTQWAGYRALEYGGSFTAQLGLEERLVLANQGIEMGAKNAIVEPGPGLERALAQAGLPSAQLPRPDEGARYVERHRLDVGTLAPQVARPPSPDRVAPASSVGGQPIDMAWIGSCVGGRAADLRQAAALLRGKRARVPLMVTPSTRGVYQACLADGTIAALVEAGATVQPPGCGACAGVHAGVQAPGDRVIATATRNFRGRMGSPEAEVWLGSAWTVAAAALAGRIVDPREVA